MGETAVDVKGEETEKERRVFRPPRRSQTCEREGPEGGLAEKTLR